MFPDKSVEFTTERDTPLDTLVELSAEPTVDNDVPRDPLLDSSVEVWVDVEVALESSPDKFVDSTFELDVALDTPFDKLVDSIVDLDVDFEALELKPDESETLDWVFIEVTFEISAEFFSSKFKKSFNVTSLPSSAL